MTEKNPEANRGYREQLAELQRDDTTSPRARYILEQHQAIFRVIPSNPRPPGRHRRLHPRARTRA